ncbi:Thoeris anti-defense Tad2 family protein [Xenorhabdus sp. KK7.4]|uniref:Thoeris anti-defense Tad2 family protein n=1 Tax=Xenorhabdus sp. KK7.4 TaxID=1851572 RepID=UPI000C047380|nr:MW1434 family type I TA system toxin [Xenorhabdus sp. KK7.4]PHM51004.1 hypothetical protein Xekk_04081 [Xenorhabdus sp. KK7.4]
MSDVNKLDDKQCPFDLSKYKSNDVVAPIGSLPWAIIQVYEGKAVGRTEWNSLPEYIHLSTKNDGSGPIHIEKHNKDGISETWEPTHEDLMACDWDFSYLLSFNLTLGVGNYSIPGYSAQDWGYISDKGDLGTGEVTFGTLTGLQTNTDIQNVLGFYFTTDGYSSVDKTISLSASSDQNNYQNVLALLSKNLYVSVDGKTYNLGISGPIGDDVKYTGTISYTGDEAQKLGVILQEKGQTKTFFLNWK